MPLDWQAVVNGPDFSDVMRLVHLAVRMDSVNVEEYRKELLRSRRAEYEATMTELARKAGCNRKGQLNEGPSLTQLNEMSITDAQSIVNTYNYDLAIAIIAIREQYPSANRHTYVKELRTWETNRAKWKDEQIALNTNLTARSLAQQDFETFNRLGGVAKLMGHNPAAEPICQGWLNRGEVPMSVAINNPSPYHLNCGHSWAFWPNKMTQDECRDLWLG